MSFGKKGQTGDLPWRPLCKILFNLFSLCQTPCRQHLTGGGYGGGAEQRSCWGPCLIGDLKTSGCSGCTELKRWPVFHSREFRTLQQTWWDSGLIYELEQSPEQSTGSRHCDWKSHPSQRLSHSLTTPNPPRDNCAMLRYRALKRSWQSSIYQVIWARRMASTALAVFEFCPIEVPFTHSSCLCFSFFPLPVPASIHAVR